MPQHAHLLAQLKALTERPPGDDGDRKALLEALRQAQFAVERPTDVLYRLSFPSAAARAAIDLKLFDIIAAQSDTVGLDELATKTGAKSLLIRRLLRILGCFGAVDEPSPCTYKATQLTRYLAQPGIQAGVKHNCDVMQPAIAAMPAFLAKTGYADIEKVLDTPFQVAHATDKAPFVWALERPATFQNFNVFMAAMRDVSPSWLDVFPRERLTGDAKSSEVPVFVDVGGGIGHQCQELMQRLPDLKRRVVLQDLPPAINHALPTPGVEKEVYDFWGEQPIRGASLYYIKSVLHDYPDAKCAEILKNQMAAMDEDSTLLVDEIVLPERGGPWKAAQMDIALMAVTAAIERTERQWEELFASVGLRVCERHQYDDEMLHTVMVIKRI